MTDITQTLEERGNRYGKFTGHAEVTTALKNVIHIELLKRVDYEALNDERSS